MKESKTQKLKNIRQLLSWAWHTGKDYRLQATLNTLVGLLLVFSDLAFVWCTKLAVDIATHVETRFTLSQAVWMLVGIIVAQISLSVASRWIRALLGVDAQNKMQMSLFRRLLGAQWGELKRFHSGDLINRIERDVRDVMGFLTESLPSFITTCVQFFGAFIFLFIMDRTLACIIIFVLPFFILCSKLYVRRMRQLTHDIRSTESNVQSVIQESLQHTLVIKSLEQISAVAQKLYAFQRGLHTKVIGKTKLATLSSVLMNVGFATGYLVTFVWGVGSLQQGLITYGTLIAFIQLVGQIQQPVRALTHFIPVFISTSTAGERLMELEAVRPEENSVPQIKVSPTGICMKDLTFSYTPESRNIFSHFNCKLPPGSITAVVGETGAGKTTLVRMLLALLHPKEGKVSLYDDKQMQIPVSPSTRINFSYVPQGNTLFSGTVRDNLLMGNPSATNEMMETALKTAAADFVLALPKGIDTPCGEMGDGFSEGQAQRIAIARALLRPANVYLFDEATSSLDEKTERIVVKNIVEQFQGKTLIFITHRPEVLNYCTQVLRLEKLS